LWTKRGYTESYIAVSCYFNNTAERAEHVMLNLYVVPYPHTGEVIVAKLNETILKWNINSDKILAVLTDNGSNMVKAIRIMKTVQQHSQSDSPIYSSLWILVKRKISMSRISMSEHYGSQDQTALSRPSWPLADNKEGKHLVS
jgi:hypothetical protein